MHFQKYFLIVLFMGVLTLPLLNTSLGIWKFERKEENRTFRDSLNFDVTNLDPFPRECEQYINDNFSFRAPLLDMYHHINYYYSRVSPHPENTIIGKEGWFFMSRSEINIYGGKLDFSDEKLDLYKKEWKKRTRYLDSLNVKAYWVICPIKHYIYSEYLPFTIIKGVNPKRVDQLNTHLKDEFPELIIDPSQSLMDAKKTTKLYYKLDNHWNFRSGKIVSQLIVNKLKSDFPNHNIYNIPDYQWEEVTRYEGFHRSVVGLEELYEIDHKPIIENEQAKPAAKYDFPPVPGFAYPWEHEYRYVNQQDSNGLRVLFIRDSFGSQLMPFVKEAFQESVFIFDAWQYKLNEDIIEKIKPDAVVFLGLETHMENFIK